MQRVTLFAKINLCRCSERRQVKLIYVRNEKGSIKTDHVFKGIVFTLSLLFRVWTVTGNTFLHLNRQIWLNVTLLRILNPLLINPCMLQIAYFLIRCMQKRWSCIFFPAGWKNSHPLINICDRIKKGICKDLKMVCIRLKMGSFKICVRTFCSHHDIVLIIFWQKICQKYVRNHNEKITNVKLIQSLFLTDCSYF